MPAAMATTSATAQTLTPLWGSINVWRKRNYTKLIWLKKEKRKSQRCRRVTHWLPRLLVCKHLQLIFCSIYYSLAPCGYTFIIHTNLNSSTRKRWPQFIADVYMYQKKIKKKKKLICFKIWSDIRIIFLLFMHFSHICCRNYTTLALDSGHLMFFLRHLSCPKWVLKVLL